MRTEFSGADSTFFTQATLDEGQYGFRHDITSSVSLNVLKYFNFSPNISYGEVYYGKTRAYRLNNEIETRTIVDPITGVESIDTTSLGDIVNDLNPGLASYRTFTAGVSMSTQIFGKVRFKRKGILGLQGLRHVIKPSISFGYSPDYANAVDYISGEDYFIRENEIDPRFGDSTRLLSPFANQIFGAPPQLRSGAWASATVSRISSRPKSGTAKTVFLRTSNSFRTSPCPEILMFRQTPCNGVPFLCEVAPSFLKALPGSTSVQRSTPTLPRYDPTRGSYKRVDVTNASEGRLPLSLTRFTSSISTNITVQKIRELFQGAEEEVVTDLEEERRKRRKEETTLFEETDLLSLFEKFSIRHTFNFSFDREFDTENPNIDDRGTLRFRQVANSIELRGALQLTNNWSVNIGQIGYDFTSKRITYPFMSFVRDLHCWEMRFSWAPQRNYYSFSIAVKPGTLDFINLPVNQNRYDGGRLF